MPKKIAPEVNAGSMADIAFLLLIFFLVTTTIASDSGINRKLPPKLPETENSPVKDRNLFQITVNHNNEFMVKDNPMQLKDLKKATIAFLDNNGTRKCNYCNGKHDSELSESPQKAVVSLKNSRETNYETYVNITNEIIAAYQFLRNRESIKLYNVSYKDLVKNYKNSIEGSSEKINWKVKLETIKNRFPEKFSEAESK